jgi:rhamnose transport system permease protein
MRSREASVALAIALLGGALALVAPGFFARGNLADIFLGNLPVLVAALGATLVILTGEIDISVGSVFAICAVAAGLVAQAGLPLWLAVAIAIVLGAGLGSLNGALVAYAGLPSIVVTLATMVALRDGLRWAMEGAWVQGLPAEFQWLGLGQAAYPIVALAIALAAFGVLAWILRHVAAGRAIYATGSDVDAARLAGIDTALVKFSAFAAAGALTGLAALLNAVRFNQIPSNAGIGLEMKVIAAVVVGGTAIRGGSGTLAGTLLGVVLLAAVGPALVFLGVSPYWERAVQGAIILAAVGIDAVRMSRRTVRAAVAGPGREQPHRLLAPKSTGTGDGAAAAGGAPRSRPPASGGPDSPLGGSR